MTTAKQAIQRSSVQHQLHSIRLFREKREEERRREEERKEAERLARIILTQQKKEEAIKLVSEACIDYLCREFVDHLPEFFDRLGVELTLNRRTGELEGKEIPNITDLREFIVSEELDEYGSVYGEFLLGNIWEELTAGLERTIKFIFAGCRVCFHWGYTQAIIRIFMPLAED